MSPPDGTAAGYLIAALVLVCWLLQIGFVVGHLLLTRWKAAELGPYVVRFNVIVLTLLTLAALNAWIPAFQSIRTPARVFSYVILVGFELNQWALLCVVLTRAWKRQSQRQG